MDVEKGLCSAVSKSPVGTGGQSSRKDQDVPDRWVGRALGTCPGHLPPLTPSYPAPAGTHTEREGLCPQGPPSLLGWEPHRLGCAQFLQFHGTPPCRRLLCWDPASYASASCSGHSWWQSCRLPVCGSQARLSWPGPASRRGQGPGLGMSSRTVLGRPGTPKKGTLKAQATLELGGLSRQQGWPLGTQQALVISAPNIPSPTCPVAGPAPAAGRTLVLGRREAQDQEGFICPPRTGQRGAGLRTAT